MTRSPGSEDQLANLLDALVEDMLSLSDEEILAEAKASGHDLEAEAKELRKQLTAALAASGRARLATARAALDKTRRSESPRDMQELPPHKKQHIVASFAANDSQLRSRLTMAARQGEGASEREIDSILQDLRDLGAIDDEGNPL